jgi:hypothetical protein
MRRDEIKQLLESEGPRRVLATINALLEGHTAENGTKYKLEPWQFSLREVWEGAVGPCEDTLPSYGTDQLMTEAINTSMFTNIIRMLISKAVIAAYDGLPTIGDSLVTTVKSSRRIENIAGFTEAEGMKDVLEGAPYEDSSIGEKYVTTTAGKRGRLVSVTEEMIMEDQTGQLLMRAQRIGEQAKVDKEIAILSAVMDKGNVVYRPSGTPVALYSTTNGNLVGDAGSITGFTTALPLVDWLTLDKIQQFHPLSISDDRQMGTAQPILWNPTQLLVPPGMNATALRISNATEVRVTTTGVASGDNRTTFTNPMKGAYTTVTSPLMLRLGISDAATTYFYGDFKKQFIWREIWPIQTFSQGRDSEQAFERDVVSRFKVRYLGGANALEHRWVLKIKAA